jgi:hypothetical protein
LGYHFAGGGAIRLRNPKDKKNPRRRRPKTSANFTAVVAFMLVDAEKKVVDDDRVE